LSVGVFIAGFCGWSLGLFIYHVMFSEEAGKSWNFSFGLLYSQTEMHYKGRGGSENQEKRGRP
jgi:hypothetical protein